MFPGFSLYKVYQNTIGKVVLSDKRAPATGDACIVVSSSLLHNVRNRPNCEGANA